MPRPNGGDRWPAPRDARLHRRLFPESRLGLVNVALNPRFRQRMSTSPDFAIADPTLFRVVVEF
ncbi:MULTISPECIES: hypothetical protein [Streptomyces]|uniref:hypothetical protein n=1 Tax=Streptomyces TaxID=1883 RepID=UPI0029B4067A|nr:hypothetical protein [Streptomyces sp. WI03-4A]MDX2591304.1 hypothetical protein [Streptomyces sp. WI03-4A]